MVLTRFCTSSYKIRCVYPGVGSIPYRTVLKGCKPELTEVIVTTFLTALSGIVNSSPKGKGPIKVKAFNLESGTSSGRDPGLIVTFIWSPSIVGNPVN